MRILVTGGAGFLGSHVADALSDAGHKVTIFDIAESAYRRFDQNSIISDILNEKSLETAVKENEVVYHFAGIADIDECAKKPEETVKYNILGTVKLLEQCKRFNIKRFVFASSAYVYSDSGYFYRSSKQACESFIENYYNLYNLKYTCLRYGSLYGDRADERNSIYRLIKEAITKNKITYQGNGDEIREFIHVRDAAMSSVEILSSEFENQYITLTGYEKFTYKQLLEMIAEILGNQIKIELIPSTRKAHYKLTPYNFSPKTGKKLVNNPHIDMGQGLLQCMSDIYEKVNTKKHQELGIIINEK